MLRNIDLADSTLVINAYITDNRIKERRTRIHVLSRSSPSPRRGIPSTPRVAATAKSTRLTI